MMETENKSKKRKLTIGEINSLFGGLEDEDYVAAVRLARKDIKEFKMGLREATETCQMYHVSPYDVFNHSRENAEKVIDEVLRMRAARKFNEMTRSK